METITFYSYKGGLGRTLAVANVACYLAQLGQKVVALDFDLEAPGLHYKIKPSAQIHWDKQKGLVDWVIDRPEDGAPDRTLDSYLVKIDGSRVGSGKIWLMPAGSAPFPTYWEKLSSLDWQELFYNTGEQGALTFLELKECIIQTLNPDFLIIDARTGITEIGGVATTLLADKVVCMLSNTKENLDGARTVLRAMLQSSRPPGLAPLQLFPVVSRLPPGEIGAERIALEEIRKFLNEPAEYLGQTLSFDEILILHTDPSLSHEERILVGESQGEPSGLLQDYLRLFAKISSDALLQQTQPIIDRALSRLLDTPDEAQKELESLAYSFNLRAAFEQLLRVYRVRNIKGEPPLRVAMHLWEIGDERDRDLVRDTVRINFDVKYSRERRVVPLEFIEDVWRHTGKGDLDFTVKISRAYRLRENFGRKSSGKSALDILLEAWEHSSESDELLAEIIRIGSAPDYWRQAKTLIEESKARILNNSKLLLEWANFETNIPANNLPEELLEAANIEALERSMSPEMFSKMLIKANRVDDARRKAISLFQTAISSRDSSALFLAGRALFVVGGEKQVVELVTQRFPDAVRGRLLDAITTDSEYRMPAQYEIEAY